MKLIFILGLDIVELDVMIIYDDIIINVNWVFIIFFEFEILINFFVVVVIVINLIGCLIVIFIFNESV